MSSFLLCFGVNVMLTADENQVMLSLKPKGWVWCAAALYVNFHYRGLLYVVLVGAGRQPACRSKATILCHSANVGNGVWMAWNDGSIVRIACLLLCWFVVVVECDNGEKCLCVLAYTFLAMEAWASSFKGALIWPIVEDGLHSRQDLRCVFLFL